VQPAIIGSRGIITESLGASSRFIPRAPQHKEMGARPRVKGSRREGERREEKGHRGCFLGRNDEISGESAVVARVSN
jgi:hypothetical protein